MTNNPKRSAGRNILFTLILLFVVFLLVEILLSVFLYHTRSRESLATVEMAKRVKLLLKGQPNPVNLANQNLVRPDSSELINKKIAEETHEANKFRYQPWIEFSNIDYNGSYVNIESSIRKTVPDQYMNLSMADTILVHFFGGSTMFGFNISDAETIPSQFVRMYKERYPEGPSLQVVNYATPTYYSYQELIQFSTLLFKGQRPDIVIFLDGVNDFWFANASYHHQSYFSSVFRQVFDHRGGSASGNAADSTAMMYVDPAGVEPTFFYNQLLENYFRNIRNATMMAGMAGVQSFFFCQPVPFYNYPRQQQDPICFKDTATRFSYIYPRIEKEGASVTNFTFLGNMLQNETGAPFVDGLHYSPGFSRKVAERIFNKVMESGIPKGLIKENISEKF